jgi:Shikimate kinase
MIHPGLPLSEGRIIAERLGQPFVDSDVLIEQRLGREIRDIFATEGEAYFRELEHATIDTDGRRPDAVALEVLAGLTRGGRSAIPERPPASWRDRLNPGPAARPAARCAVTVVAFSQP